MANEIYRLQKLGKQKSHQPDSTTDYYNAPSTTSICNEMFNENNYIASKESLAAETHFSTTSYVHDKPADNIQTAPVSSPHKKT